MSYFRLQNKYVVPPNQFGFTESHVACVSKTDHVRSSLDTSSHHSSSLHRFSHSSDVNVNWNRPRSTSFLPFAGHHVSVVSSRTNSDWLSITKWHVTQLNEHLSVDTSQVARLSAFEPDSLVFQHSVWETTWENSRHVYVPSSMCCYICFRDVMGTILM